MGMSCGGEFFVYCEHIRKIFCGYKQIEAKVDLDL